MAETNGTSTELGVEDAKKIPTEIEVKKESSPIKSEPAADPTSPTKVKSENSTVTVAAVKSEPAADPSSPTKVKSENGTVGLAAVAATKTVKRENVSNGEPPSTLEKQLIRQIEFYFGDVNLPRDKFLLEQVKLDDGWVPLETMFKFKRLAGFSTDPDTIIAALSKSTEQLMEVSECGDKIRRSPGRPLPVMNEERRRELATRTVYVKGYPATGATLDDVLEHFAPHAPLENVQMRSYRDKASNAFVFKGSVFATFRTREGAQAYLDLPTVKYGETELVRKWQMDYIDDKRKEREVKKAQGKGAAGGAAREAPGDAALPTGCVLHFAGLPGGNETTREQIKSQLAALGTDVAFIDYSKGDAELWVRFHKENSGKNFISEHTTDGTFKLCESDVKVRLLEGEEETTFLAKTKQDIANCQRNQGRHRGNQRGRGRGGRGGRARGGGRGQKRRGSPSRSDDHPRKKQAV